MKKETWNLCRILVAAAILVPILVLEYTQEARWAEITVICLSAAAFVLVGYDVIIKAVRRLLHAQFLDESFLMTIASIGAFAIGEYPEAVAVMLFFQVGEYFEKRAVKRSRKSIAALLAINPDTANLVDDEGERIVPCEEVAVGQIVLVKPGERVPFDGVVVDGASDLDMSSLNGESVPRTVAVGDQVMSGAVNIGGVLRVEVTKPYGESTASKMIALVEKAREQKAPVENFITTFAKFYTPIVVGIALIIGVVVPLCIHYNDWPTWAFWLKKAMVFLVVSCPCALVISVPLTYFGAIGLAGRMGILIKGGHVFAAVTKVDTLVMDKTGTVTEGRFAVSSVWPEDKRREVLSLAYLCERHSNHPIAKSICDAYATENASDAEAYAIEEIRGKGMVARNGEAVVLAGNASLMAAYDVDVAACPTSVGTVVYVAQNGALVGCISIKDAVKADSRQTIETIKGQQIETIMLSGDSASIVAEVAQEVGVDAYYAETLPEDKVNKVVEWQKEGKTVAFVGDGINDAPVIATAAVGVAMGGVGSDAAIESADVVLMYDSLTQIHKLRRISFKTKRIVVENIVFALGVKLCVMALSFTPVAQSAVMMWLAVGADVGVAVLAILNAMRAGGKK